VLGGPRIQMYLQVINERRKLARYVLLGVLLLFGMFALWARQYAASAFVQLTSSSTEHPRASAVDAARSTLNDEQLAAILERIPLYPEMVRTHGEASAIRYMRSKISLEPAGPGKYNAGEVRVTYLSSEKATVIKVANALSQSLTEVKPSAVDSLSVDIAARIERQLEDSRSKLKELAARQPKPAKGEGVLTSRRRTSVHEDEKKLSVLEQQRGRVGSSAAPVSVPLPETSAAKALQQQIRDAEARLVELRQRYTDQYPDVQDTQERLQELRSKLNLLPVESPALPPRDDGRIAREEEQIRADQARAQKEVRRDAARKETKRDKSSKSSAVDPVYALELDRYQALLRAQRNMKEYQDEELGPARMRFRVVQKATQAKVAGIAVNPFYWLTGLLAGLLAATLSVLYAHHRETPPGEQIAIRSEFEREELVPHYRHN
jgi:hypothetical protein